MHHDTLIAWLPALFAAGVIILALNWTRAALFGVRPFDSRLRRYLWLAIGVALTAIVSEQLARLGLVYWPVGVATWLYFFLLSRAAERGSTATNTADEEF